MANKSLKDDISEYLKTVASIRSIFVYIGWGQMPDTATSKIMLIYAMISDVRIGDDIGSSSYRNQRWRFWICFPADGTKPKENCMLASNALLDALHNMRGTFGSTSIHYIENDSNADPFFDINSNCYIIIQDYKLKMRTLEV